MNKVPRIYRIFSYVVLISSRDLILNDYFFTYLYITLNMYCLTIVNKTIFEN